MRDSIVHIVPLKKHKKERKKHLKVRNGRIIGTFSASLHCSSFLDYSIDPLRLNHSITSCCVSLRRNLTLCNHEALTLASDA